LTVALVDAVVADELRGPDPVAPFGPLVSIDSSDPVVQLVAVSGTPQRSARRHARGPTTGFGGQRSRH